MVEISSPFLSMLSTKYLLQTRKHVPDTWIFEHYCKLDEKLTGQSVKIKSVFNPKEKTPSMCLFVYPQTNKYVFKDFSTGYGGSAMLLIQKLFGYTYQEASVRVVEDYNNYLLLNNGDAHKITEFKVRSNFRVTSHKERTWSVRDQKFWSSFNISSSLLQHYNVRPLSSYTMTKEEDGELKSLEIKGLMIYGYFTKDGVLYKIYQPKVKEHKFIKIKDYLQGSDQLEDGDCLIIASSLKDTMVMKSLGLNCSFIVPDSETTTIRPLVIEELKNRFKTILTLFDNDEAGIAAMKKYKELYDIGYVYFNLEKDVADAVKVHGADIVREKLVPLINNKLNSNG